MTTTVQTNEPSFTDEHILIKALPDNIEEMLGVPDARLLLVIDKNYGMAVFTSPQMEPEAEAIVENATRQEHGEASPPMAMNVPRGMMHARGGMSSMEIKQEADGCFWLIRGQRRDDGSLIESDRTCIGMQGCPVGKKIQKIL